MVCPLPDNVQQGLGIIKVHQDGVTLDDGEVLNGIDIIMFCTGYKYTFPFLDDKCMPKIVDERVPLYKHIIHPDYPTLSFIGIPKVVCPFPQFDCQVRFTIAGLTGTKPFPSKEDMEADIERDFNWRQKDLGMPFRHAHHMGDLQWGYNDELAKLGGFDPIPKVVEKLYKHVHDVRTNQLQIYKQCRFELEGPEAFKVIKW